MSKIHAGSYSIKLYGNGNVLESEISATEAETWIISTRIEKYYVVLLRNLFAVIRADHGDFRLQSTTILVFGIIFNLLGIWSKLF